MELKGKKVLFLGDSITQGVGVSSVEHRYTDVFAKITGAEVFNYGISGTRIARQHSVSDNRSFDQNFVDRSLRMNDEADFVVVFGGTNDYGHGDAPIGCFTDTADTTFYGAMHTLCKNLYERYPTATVLFMTPLHRLTELSTLKTYQGRYATLKDYVDIIREVCEFYAIPVLDLYSRSGMQPLIEKNRELYMKDGLHPTDAGAQRIAHMLASFIGAL